MHRSLLAGLVAVSALAAAEDDGLVFRSDVSLVRVDAQVLDRRNKAVLGLEASDFVLYENGRQQEIKNFALENMPMDVLLLLDVSGSMDSHIGRVAEASREALRVLGPQDRVAIMVFDRQTRVRMPFREGRDNVERELNYLLRDETWDGGTDVTAGLYSAIQYVNRNARSDARRAIVVVTDDQTERNRDVSGVNRALSSSNIVLSALIAPAANRGGGVFGGSRGGGLGGGGLGGPLGGIILGRRYPSGGSGPVYRMPQTNSAGSSEIARESGGDSFQVDDAAALENTLARLRQRYALHFKLPEGVKENQVRDVEVDLTAEARRRYPDAEIRSRRLGAGQAEVASVRKPAIPTQRREVPAKVAPEPDTAPAERPTGGGWRRVKPGEQPD